MENVYYTLVSQNKMKTPLSLLGLTSLLSRVSAKGTRAKEASWTRERRFRRSSLLHELSFESLEKRLLLTDSDDSISEAFLLGAVSTTAKTVSASISPDTDVNMVGFDVNAGQVVDFDVDTPLNGPGGLGAYIRLFNTQGQQLDFNNDGAAPGENQVGFDSYLRYTFPTSGTYYLGVSNFNNVQYNPLTGDGDTAGGLYSIGSYTLTVQALPVDLDDSISEAVQLGAISATPITVNASIGTDIDVNIVAFSVGTGQVVDFDIDTALNGPGGLGSYIRLFNAQGQQLAFNNDAAAPGESSVGFDAYLRFTFATAGTYYLGVSNLNNAQYNPVTGNGDTSGGFNSIGAYQLILQTAPVIVPDPNDSISEAASLGAISTTPTTVSATISPDTDVNMVSFNVTAGQVVDFDIDTSLNGSGGLGSYLRLFDAQGAQLAFNDDGVAPGESRLGYDAYVRFTFATAGTYYLGVSNFNNINYNAVTGDGDTAGGLHTIGNYQLIVQALAIDTNDSFSESVQLGSVSATPITVSASLVTDIDVNMVAFSVVSGQVVDIDIDTSFNGPGGLGSYIRLFDVQGQQLAFNNDAAAPGENTVGFDAYLRYTFATAGVYYLGVSNLNNVQYDPITGSGDTPGGFNTIGTYQLILQTAPVAVPDPNDSIAEATSLGAISTTPTISSANISPDTDVNMVSFIVTAGQVVDFDIDTTLNGSGGLGSYLRLFDGQGAQLAFNDDGVAPGESRLGFDAYLRYTFATAGTYFLGVSNFNNITYNAITGDGDTAGGLHATGGYQLTIQAIPIDTNDTIAEATQLGAVTATPFTISASIVTDIDVNMVAFSVTSGQVADFDIDTALNGPGGLGSYIRLFNAQGQQLAFNNDAAAPGENTVGFDAYLRYTFVTAGTYYLGVSNLNNVQYDPIAGNGDTAGGFNSIGAYQLIIQTASVAVPDPNDTISEATALGAATTTPTTINADISPDTDVNMVSFVVGAGQVVDFDIDTALNGSGGLGSYIRLFDGQGTQLAFNDDGVAPGESRLGFDAYLRYFFATAGTYYLGVSNFNNNNYSAVTGEGDTAGGLHTIGSYQLTVQALPVDTNDSIAEAAQLGAISATPKTVTASLVTDIDVNMVAFSVTSGQVVDFDIDTALNGPGGLGSYIRLFNAQGQQLAFNNDAAAPGENTVGFDAYLRYSFVSAGTYYLGVSNLNNVQYDPITGNGDTAGGFNSIGSYQLIVQTAPATVSDPNDAISEANSLGAVSTSTTTLSANISPDTDVNMVSFIVGAGQVVDFDIDTPLNGPGGLGSYIRVFDGQGTQLAFNDDGVAPGESRLGYDAYLRYTFATAGIYYLGVSNFNNINYNAVTGDGDTAGGSNTVGNYQLIVQVVPLDPNDSISEALALGSISTTPITVNADIATDIDVNMVAFFVTAGQSVDLDVDTTLNGPGGLGSYIRLFNAQGQQLAFNNDAAAPGENTVGFDAYLRYTFVNAGTYYLGVSNLNNVQYDPITGNGDTAGGFNSIGGYQLILQTAPAAVSDPNDAISEATPLGAISTTLTTVSAIISPDTDVNMVSFSVSAGQVVDFDIDTTLNGSGGLGSYIRLFDSQGAQLSFNDDGVAPGESRLGFDAYFRYTFATAGTYYLGVSNFNNVNYNAVTGDGDTAGGLHTVGSYQLIVQALPVDTNDSIAEAQQLGVVSANPITVSASLVTDIDVNMVAFSVTTGQIVDFDIDTALNGPGGLGSYIRLFNAQGQQLAFNNDAAAPGENTVGFDAYLRYTFLTAGTYYVGVSNLNNVQYDSITGNGDTAGGFNSIGSYQLILQTAPALTSDPNDTISEATSLGTISTTPTTVSAVISPDTDVNMVSFNVSAGQVVDFDIDTTLNGSGGLGSYIRLFDAQGAQLSFNDDGVAPGESRLGFDAYMRYTFATAGTYYLGVSNVNNVNYNAVTGDGDTSGGLNTVGSYQLILQALPIDTNDSIAEASQLGVVSANPITVSASLVTDIDVNMVAFSVSTGQVVDFDVDTALNGPGGLGSYSRLFNAQGQQLAFNNDAAAPGENTLGFDAYLRYTFVTSGTYYLGVSNSNNVQYDPITGNGDTAGGFNSIGSYQLILQTAPAASSDPNDAISEATSLGAITTTPTTVSASISPNTDVNMVGFNVSAGQVVDFDIDTELNGPGGLGSYIRLFSAQGAELAFNNDAAAPDENTTGLDAYLRYTFVAGGTYYLGVSNSNNTQYDPVTGNGDTAGGANATGSYQLILQTPSNVIADPNDTISEASLLGSITLTPSTVNAAISPATDVNMVGFTVIAGQVVDFDIDSLLNGPGGLGSYLRLFDAQGNQMAFNGAAAAPDEHVIGYDAYLRYTFSVGGSYFLGVSNYNNIQYDPLTGNGDSAGGANSTGGYQLNIQTATVASTDQDDSISKAIPLGSISTTPVSVDFVISPDTDVDMYSFSVIAGQVVDFDIDTMANGSGGLNSFLRLFDVLGQPLAINNDAKAPGESVVGFDAYLRYEFLEAGTFYIAVSNNSNIQYSPITGNGDVGGGQNPTGSYRLILHALSTTLSVSIDVPSIAEKNGHAVGTVSRTDADLSKALVVNLSSSDITAASVPVSVVIPINQTSVSFVITAVDDHIVDGTSTVMITATASGFTPGASTLKVTDSNGFWHNSTNPLDVDIDSTVSPLDVLSIVNYLNQFGSGPVTSSNPPPYLDVDSDNFVSPLDALVVINYLNAQGSGQGEGESVNTAVPIDFIDDYFTNFARNRSNVASQRMRGMLV